MPLPSVLLFGAKQCTSKSKRTKKPCQNPAAYGCVTCRFHGARKLESIRRGDQHPNYLHGERTLEVQRETSAQNLMLAKLEDAMHLLDMTTAPRSCGRKPKGYKKITSIDEIEV